MKPASASSAADRYPLPNWARLLTGVLATGLIAYAGYRWHAQALLAKLGRPVAAVMLSAGVTDGSADWATPAGWTWRRARLSGTADAATRAAVLAEVRRQPGIADAEWVELP